MRNKVESKCKDTPKVSVIMPSLNVAEYIDECIQSVINQTLREIEIICVDAGSTDGTWEKLCSYAENPEITIPIRLLHSDMKSYGYQVNWGIREAKGEYVAIVETDDYTVQDMYETLYNIADQTKADVVKANYDCFYTGKDGRKVFQRIELWQKDKLQYNKVIDPSKIAYLYAADYSIWKGIYNRKFLKENAIWLNESKGAAFQDIGFAQQVLACARRAYYSDRSFYRYRTDRDTSSMNSLHGLQYSHQEFKRLLEDETLFKKLVYPAGLYRHMVQSFHGELNKLLKATDYDVHSEHIEPYAKWFVEQIGQALALKLVSPADLDIYYQYFQMIADDIEKYAADLKQREMLLRENTELILAKTQGKKTVIFGAGICGKRAAAFLKENEREIAAICDNNRELWGTHKYDCIVVAPQESVKRFGECIYLIANKYQVEEIEAQLCDIGIQKQSILKFQ